MEWMETARQCKANFNFHVAEITLVCGAQRDAISRTVLPTGGTSDHFKRDYELFTSVITKLGVCSMSGAPPNALKTVVRIVVW